MRPTSCIKSLFAAQSLRKMTQHFLTLLTRDPGLQGKPDIIIRSLMCTESYRFAVNEIFYLSVYITNYRWNGKLDDGANNLMVTSRLKT